MTAVPPLPITFSTCDLLTGRYLGDLAVKPQGPLIDTLMRAENVSFTIDVPDLPPIGEWEVLTEPATTLIIAEVSNAIVWGGIVWKREHGPHTVTLSTLTVGSIFDRRYIPCDYHTGMATYPRNEQTAIIADIVSKIGDYGFVVATPPTEPSILAQLVVMNTDNKRVSDILNQLAGYLNGCEWAVQLAWADETRQTVVKTLASSFRVGSSDPSDRAPNVTAFDDTHMRSWTFVDADWSSGAGATSVTAFSNSGVNGSNAYSHTVLADRLLAGGFPLLEERFSPAAVVGPNQSSTLDTISGLDGHAHGRFREVGNGTSSFSCVLEASVCPLPGRDWLLGDYANVTFTDPRRWAGPQGADQRIVSWQLTVTDGFVGDLTPIFWADTGQQYA